MTDAASQEYHAAGIAQATNYQPDETTDGQVLNQGIQGNQDHPSHEEINNDLVDSWAVAMQAVNDDTNDGQSPDYTK